MKNSEISKGLLVNKFSMILDNSDRLELNDQSIMVSYNEQQRSPEFGQKQPLEAFCKKRCFKNFRKFHRKTPVLESLFNNVAGLQACNFIKKRLQHCCFLMKFAKFLRTPILKYICEILLLFVSSQNTITNSSGEVGLDETSTACKISIFLHVTILLNQMQSYHLYVS